MKWSEVQWSEGDVEWWKLKVDVDCEVECVSEVEGEAGGEGEGDGEGDGEGEGEDGGEGDGDGEVEVKLSEVKWIAVKWSERWTLKGEMVKGAVNGVRWKVKVVCW